MPESAASWIGVISDTHGKLRPEALEALQGCQLILHAGDVGKAAILDELNALAPTRAVRGNVDLGLNLDSLPETLELALAGERIYMQHIREAIPFDPAQSQYSLIVYGHSHQPEISQQGGVTFFNPGSAGPRRFRLPVTVGKIYLTRNGLVPEIVELPVGAP